MLRTPHPLRADAVMLLAAVIWGGAFVAQRVAMRYMGPLTFGGLRFALGALALVPLIMWRRNGPVRPVAELGSMDDLEPPTVPPGTRAYIVGGGAAGLVLFAAISFQQIGLEYTSAGKAGFITGLYVPLVPILALFVGQRTGRATWVGAGVAICGLYLLSVTGRLEVGRGDGLVSACAVLCAVHVLIVARLAPQLDPLKLALVQFATVAVASLAVAVPTEPLTAAGLHDCLPALLYGGLLSVAVAYTLQLVGQREAPPGHAAIVLSLESVFAAVFGAILLAERFGPRELVGAGLMLAGALISQSPRLRRRELRMQN